MMKSDTITAISTTILILMVVFVLRAIQSDVDNDPVYPMPLHPGTQVIMHDADLEKGYHFKFINANKPVTISETVPGTEGKVKIKDMAMVTEGVGFIAK